MDNIWWSILRTCQKKWSMINIYILLYVWTLQKNNIISIFDKKKSNMINLITKTLSFGKQLVKKIIIYIIKIKLGSIMIVLMIFKKKLNTQNKT